MNRVRLFDLPFDSVDLRGALARVEQYVAEGTFHQGCGVNVDQLVRTRRDAEFQRMVAEADLITADGTPVVWASRLLGRGLPERVPAIDLFEALLGEAALRGWRVYLLGARPEVLDQATELYRCRHSGLRVSGTHHGYFETREERGIAEAIRDARPQLLFIATSSPKKERFIDAHKDLLAEVPFVLGVGGAFDIAAGLTRRAPPWVARIGMEWFYRFAQEPRRLARRYFVDDVAFLGMVARERMRRDR